MYPEIGFDTKNTKNYIISKIKEVKYNKEIIKLDIIEIYDSLIITLKTKESKILGFRADIDGLEIKEQNNCNYKSTNNYMHACGHDAHTSILLFLIIDILNHPEILQGTIRCIFQTAEEGPGCGGAYYLYNHNLIKEIDYFYALHVNSELKRNSIFYNDSFLMASSTTFKLELFGKESHITRFQEGIDVLKKGILIYKPNSGTGKVAGATLVKEGDNLLLVGRPNSIYISESDVPELSRTSMGNIMIKNSNILSVVK